MLNKVIITNYIATLIWYPSHDIEWQQSELVVRRKISCKTREDDGRWIALVNNNREKNMSKRVGYGERQYFFSIDQIDRDYQCEINGHQVPLIASLGCIQMRSQTLISSWDNQQRYYTSGSDSHELPSNTMTK